MQPEREGRNRQEGRGGELSRTGQGQGQRQGRGLERWSGSSPFGLGTFSPFGFLLDRLFEDFTGRNSLANREWAPSGFGELARSMWSPQIETFVRDNELVVRADLPGLKKDDVQIEVTDDALIVRGERRQEHEERGNEGQYWSERSYGSFYRAIPLPQGVEAGDINANFDSGVLEITMPVPEEARGRRIEIKEGASGQRRVA